MPKDVYLVMVDADEGDIAAALRVKALPTFMNFIHGDLQDVYSSGSKDEVLNFFLIAHYLGETIINNIIEMNNIIELK